jgi:hypothetical protein
MRAPRRASDKLLASLATSATTHVRRNDGRAKREYSGIEGRGAGFGIHTLRGLYTENLCPAPPLPWFPSDPPLRCVCASTLAGDVCGPPHHCV